MHIDSRSRSSVVRPSPVFLGIVSIAIVGGVLAWRAGGDVSSGRIGVFLLVVAGWVVTLCLHEFAHAFVAWRAGDHDVVIRGYLTLDPRKYTQPLLSIGLPVLFLALGGIGLPGGAVYVRTGAMPPRVQTRVALAGPTVNAIAAVILLVVVRMFGVDSEHQVFWYGLSFLAFLQVMATILNLLPVPGLDGYAALEPHLKPSTQASLGKIKPFGLLLLIALLFVPQINTVFFDTIYSIFGLSGVPEVYAAFGGYLMQFWR
ncbi:site-2 protease family protein [Rhodococcus spongiicola]|uniref:Site-2 protease family protein n=1 Tax=Rhodococcus spongiicola TaxID=2487352 RepID=A0A3S3AIV8_9NOCA|nr:site-2 protease family protein [Rhodococcus spongiicola]RVW01690.1 site-2 protease family protein [Rhodococcus spongiicola]